MKTNISKIIVHPIAIALFVLMLLAYFRPVTEGYKLRQGDNINYIGTSKEIRDYRDKFNDEPLWTNTVFGGSTATMISVKYHNNWMTHIERAMQLWLPHPVNIIFICMLGFYILFLALRVDPWLAIVGAIAFGFSTYTFIILEAGHNAKAVAIAWIGPVIGSAVYTYRHKSWLGAVLFMLFMALEIKAGHLQMTYYMVMILVMYGIVEFINFIMKNEIKSFFIRTGFLVVALFFAILPNYSTLKSVMEITKETTRGQSELTIGPDGKSNKKDKTSGLDRSYITDWSYGKLESINLLIPNAMGGASEALGNHPELLEKIDNPAIANQIAKSSAYWGEQQFTSGPTYLGAVAITLFILSLLFIKDITKWGFFAVTVLGLMLAWGKNLPGLTDFFIDYVPGYNKFRAVSTLLVIVQVTVPLLGVWGLSYLVKHREEFLKNIKSFYIVGGAFLAVVLLIVVAGLGSFGFLSSSEKQMFADAVTQGGPQQMGMINEMKKELVSVRSSLFLTDALRSLAFIAVTLLVIWAYIKGFFVQYVLYGVVGFLVLVDLWMINMRYLNNDELQDGTYMSWILPQEQSMPHLASATDYAIFGLETQKQPQLLQSIAQLEQDLQKQKMADGAENTAVSAQESESIRFRELNFATNYRVLNLQNPFNDARTSYFHKSIGGYHGAKQKRIQEIIEFYYQKEIQEIVAGLQSNDMQKIRDAFKKTPVLNMMNARYVVFNPNAKGYFTIKSDTMLMPTEQPGLMVNDMALGNAWLVKNIQEVKDDNEEIMAIGKANLGNTVVITKKEAEKIKAKAGNGTGTITLKTYRPNKLVYEYNANSENMAVFSEVYAAKGWTAKVDGKPTDIARVNYFVRGIMVPAGVHTIEFDYDLPAYRNGEKISLVGSILLVAILLFTLYRVIFGKKQTPEEKQVEKTGVID